ncbi:hypothetical protein [Brevibacillus brevis]|uniref:hypothetical protein n=1 Tax=Brevibacillus brevis TaxID=1393 RepID=UPI000D10A4B4|nr:hypothetical protein [Brevibacillus brevis]PSJ66240.1 hypothetical protein C7J99_26240 [Brevibacillus brevis]RED21743.1 hypothetical protein DES34_1188 [Brevibacillus brevis]GEC92491.1 hypothetical protein BBR01nite_48220 [Brevibacillus brevis]VEF92606.1 Uncharacterised protein [Brevibacillus brevis]
MSVQDNNKNPGKRQFKRPNKGMITYSKIAKKVHNKLIDESQDGKALSSRQLERLFESLLYYIGLGEGKAKDENEQYAFEVEKEAIVSAISLELSRKDSYLKKIAQGKEDTIEVEDMFIFFNQMMKHTSGEMNEEERRSFLLELDENLSYSLLVCYYNISSTLHTIVKMIHDYPYIHQLHILNEIQQEVFAKYEKQIRTELDEIQQHRNELEELLADIEGPDTPDE